MKKFFALAALFLTALPSHARMPLAALAQTPQYALAVSSHDNRASASFLASDSVLTGNVYVFSSSANALNANPPGIAHVCYCLDRPATATPDHCENFTPYDLKGTFDCANGSGTCGGPWNTAALRDGWHTLTQVLALTTGSTEIDIASFRTYNGSLLSLRATYDDGSPVAGTVALQSLSSNTVPLTIATEPLVTGTASYKLVLQLDSLYSVLLMQHDGTVLASFPFCAAQYLESGPRGATQRGANPGFPPKRPNPEASDAKSHVRFLNHCCACPKSVHALQRLRRTPMTTRLWLRLAEFLIALVLSAVVFDAWRADRRDRAQLAADLAAGRQALAQAAARQHDRDAQLLQTLAAVAAGKRTVTTPAQIIHDLPNQIPLPAPITLQSSSPTTASGKATCSPGPACGPEGLDPSRISPNTKSNPAATQAVIPIADLKPLYDFALDCKACQAKLAAAQADLTDERAKTIVLTRERNEAVRAAKGGSLLRRIARNAKWLAIGAAAGAIAAKSHP